MTNALRYAFASDKLRSLNDIYGFGEKKLLLVGSDRTTSTMAKCNSEFRELEGHYHHVTSPPVVRLAKAFGQAVVEAKWDGCEPAAILVVGFYKRVQARLEMC